MENVITNWTILPVALLTHRVRVTHICVGKLPIFGSDNGLSPGRRQTTLWTNAGMFLIWPLRINFQHFQSRKCIWKCRLENVCHFVSASMYQWNLYMKMPWSLFSMSSLAMQEFTGKWWIPRINAQSRGKCFYCMMSSCHPNFDSGLIGLSLKLGHGSVIAPSRQSVTIINNVIFLELGVFT